MQNQMNEYEIIDQIEDIITSAKQTVFSDKITISKDEMLDLIYYLKNAIKQRDQEEEAKNKEFMRMLSQAKLEQTIQENPEHQAEDLKRAALLYADTLLAKVQENLENTLSTIKDNRNELNQ